MDAIQKLTKKADEEVQKERLDICMACEHLYTKMNICKKCGCYVPSKVKRINSFCPIKKW